MLEQIASVVDFDGGSQLLWGPVAKLPEPAPTTLPFPGGSRRPPATPRSTRMLLAQLPAALARCQHHLVAIKGMDGCYLAANEGFARELGVLPEMLIGQRDADLLPAAEAARIAAHDIAAYSSGGSNLVREAFGRLEPTLEIERVALLDRGGRPQALLLIGREVASEARTAPAAPLAAAALGPRAIQAVGGALRSILHRAIDSRAHAYLPAGSTPGTVHPHGAFAGLLHHLEDFLEIERIRGGMESFERVPFELDDALVEGTRLGLWRAEADVVIETDYGFPRRFYGDLAHVRQLVALGVGRLAEHRPGDVARLVIGFDERQAGAARMVRFDFQRQGPASAGSGWPGAVHDVDELGLTLIQELAERMGGEIEIHPDAELSVWLPLEPWSAGVPDACGHADEIVLVADRSTAVRRSLRSELDLAGYASVGIETPGELLRQLKTALEEGSAIFRVYLEESFVADATAREALLAAVRSVVGSDRVVILDSTAGAVARGDVERQERSLHKPVCRTHLRETLGDRTSREAAAEVASAALTLPGAAGRVWVEEAEAVGRFDGDAELWRVLLGQFELRYRDLCERIQLEMAERSSREVAELAHRVATVASSLGLEPLAESLSDFCAAVTSDAGTRVETSMRELERVHAGTFAAIDPLLTAESVRRAEALSGSYANRPLAAA